jgi:isopenicillin N synthase-like dioxygenase
VPDDEYHRRSERWFARNVLPAEPQMVAAFRAWYEAMQQLSWQLLDVFGVALGIGADALQEKCRRSPSSLSINWYPSHRARPAQPGQFRAGPHTDFGTFTILDRQSGAGGLQVQVGDDWIDAPFVRGALTVNIGDLMELWTAGRWRSTRHRVLPPPTSAPDEELVSLIFFHGPEHDALIEPLFPTNDARFGAVVAGDYLTAKLGKLAV